MSEIITAEQYLCARVQELEEINENQYRKLNEQAARLEDLQKEREFKDVLVEYGIEALFKEAFTGTGYSSDVRNWTDEEAPIEFAEYVERNTDKRKLPNGLSFNEYKMVCHDLLSEGYSKAYDKFIEWSKENEQ